MTLLQLFYQQVSKQFNLKELIQIQHHCYGPVFIFNDPSFDLDPALGKSINYDSFEPIVIAAKRQSVSKFIFNSSPVSTV